MLHPSFSLFDLHVSKEACAAPILLECGKTGNYSAVNQEKTQ